MPEYLKSSLGVKRYVSSFLLALAAVVSTIPVLSSLTPLLLQGAALFGGVGVAHAAAKGTLLSFKWSSLTALVAVLIELSKHVPALEPYSELLLAIGALLGLGGLVNSNGARRK